MIYLDNNATTRPSAAVVGAVSRALGEYWANPSSVHRAGQWARHEMELARGRVAELLGVTAARTVFTSGGTESLLLAMESVLEVWQGVGVPVVVTTAVEHAAVREPLERWEKRGRVGVVRLPVGRDGLVDLKGAAGVLPGVAPAMVVLGWANNETGGVQPVGEIDGLLGGRYGRGVVPVILDATQWVGKMVMGGGLPPCDYLACSAHKWHGPKGVGVLWVKPGRGVVPTLMGTQEQGRRGGTENVAGIVGAGVAAGEARVWLSEAGNIERQRGLRDRFERGVLSRVSGSVVNGPGEAGKRLWNTSNIGFPRLEAEALLMAFSERGLYASAGAACSSGSLDPSPVLLAMGVPAELAHGSVRFSLSRETTEAEVDEGVEIVVAGVERVRGSGGV